MDSFFNFFSRKKRLISFTERLSELVSSGIPLQKSLGILGRISSGDKKLSEFCISLQKSLAEGSKFSAAMSMSDFVKTPDWYLAYISVAEECGNLASLLLHLKNLLSHEKESREKFLSAILYPGFLVLLTALSGFFSVRFFLPAFSELFCGGEKSARAIEAEALRTMLFADLFLFAGFFLLVFFLGKVIRVSPCLNVLRTMDFLSENSLPTLAAVNCAFAFCERDKKLAGALLSVREQLLDGEKIALCFGKCFEEAGFKKEGLLLSENLSLCEETGKNNGFKKTANYIWAKHEGQEKAFLALVQPILLVLASFYITLILKTAFLPYITNFGGLI